MLTSEESQEEAPVFFTVSTCFHTRMASGKDGQHSSLSTVVFNMSSRLTGIFISGGSHFIVFCL